MKCLINLLVNLFSFSTFSQNFSPCSSFSSNYPSVNPFWFVCDPRRTDDWERKSPRDDRRNGTHHPGVELWGVMTMITSSSSSVEPFGRNHFFSSLPLVVSSPCWLCFVPPAKDSRSPSSSWTRMHHFDNLLKKFVFFVVSLLEGKRKERLKTKKKIII